MNETQVNIKTNQLMAAVNGNLNQQFFVESRDKAKGLYNALSDGKSQPFMKLDLGDGVEVLCEIELDYSEYVGKLNFGKFRRGLAMMMIGIQKRLEAQESLNAMNSSTGELMFNVPGVLKSDNQVNIIVSSFRQLAPGLATIRLMYLDPEAYAKAAGVNLDDVTENDTTPDQDA